MTAQGAFERDNGQSGMPGAVDFEPVRVLEIELSDPLPDVPVGDEKKGVVYGRALALVRLHSQTLGVVELDLGEAGLSAQEIGQRIWRVLGDALNAHLREDGLAEVEALGAAGLSPDGTPRCLQEREKFLTNAPFASIIVATRDRADSLKGSLDSLLGLEYPDYEIIVVDNASSTEATSDLVRERYGSEPKVRYVREKRPGLGNAHNRGLQEVAGDFVAFTDDDITADRYWLAELVSAFDETDNVGGVTGLAFAAELETPAQVWFEQSSGWSSRHGCFEMSCSTRAAPRRG